MTTNTDNLPELTARFFNRAGDDAELSERMSFADTVVHIHYTDLPASQDVCTVWLDRTPIGGEVGAIGQPEIELYATAGVFMDLFAGRVALPIAIVRGDVEYRGPVRKFLRVVPILSSFDFDMFRDSPPIAGGALER
jgi:hypothetical protein